MIILIDNYDSFSYNLFQLVCSSENLRQLCCGEEPEVKVIRNDELTVNEISLMNPTHLIISPGPGKPSEAGICIEAIQKLGKKIPILGVCLGHQTIFEACGGKVSYAKKLMHGKTSEVNLDTDSALFRNMEKRIPVARYHSLAGVKETLPECLKITASTDDGEIMAVEHRQCRVYGVQFHPESVLTPDGKEIIENFFRI